MPVFSADVPVTREVIAAIISALTLTVHRQADIALWSGGPRFLFIPFGLGDVFDLHALPPLLSNLFVGLPTTHRSEVPHSKRSFVSR